MRQDHRQKNHREQHRENVFHAPTINTCAPAAGQPITRAPTSTAPTGNRLWEKGSTNGGPEIVNTPIGTRKALISSKRWCASSNPRSPAVLMTTGIERPSR